MQVWRRWRGGRCCCFCRCLAGREVVDVVVVVRVELCWYGEGVEVVDVVVVVGVEQCGYGEGGEVVDIITQGYCP